jgi:predicted nucleic acid-binding protein
VKGYVLDTGALIALERNSAFMLTILKQVRDGKVQAVLPQTVIAQVWRGTPKQANVARLINSAIQVDGSVVFDELTEERAQQIGIRVGAVHHPDIVDVHVALAAAERGHAVLTSDDADIAKVSPGLVLIHV